MISSRLSHRARRAHFYAMATQVMRQIPTEPTEGAIVS
jgi:hypothetical protein